MNKYEEYQEALKTAYEMMNTTDFGSAKIGCEALKVLTELVDKATPKKVKEPKLLNGHKNTFIDGYCPNCNEHNFRCNKYCMHCGQKLDWEENEDE